MITKLLYRFHSSQDGSEKCIQFTMLVAPLSKCEKVPETNFRLSLEFPFSTGRNNTCVEIFDAFNHG